MRRLFWRCWYALAPEPRGKAAYVKKFARIRGIPMMDIKLSKVEPVKFSLPE